MPGYSKLMNVQEVAEYLGIHIMTVYSLTRRKKIPHARVGNSYRFDSEVLDAWLRAQMRRSVGGRREKSS